MESDTEQIFKTVCGLCHSSCGVKVYVRDGKIIKAESTPEHPVNKGWLCLKPVQPEPKTFLVPAALPI